MTAMHVACIQMDITWEDKIANYARVRTLLNEARLPKGALALLPEMFSTGFSLNVSGIAEDQTRETEKFLAQVAADHEIFLLGGVVTFGPDGRGRNEAVLIGPDGQERTRYCKLHPFSFVGENNHFVSGADCVTAVCGEFAVAPFICYDLRFPEVFRCAMRRGVELFAVIANWPQAREAHWLTLLRARAIENQAYMAAVNRCGHDHKQFYSGHSQIIDPHGEILADAGESERVISAALNLETLRVYRREFPGLQDIRPEFLGKP
ncbi:MAG: carbon-nitrogen family hydrolase [Planctomycetota bacterium]